ncbi:hypothetical protein [Hyphomicrobium sp.]
MKRKALDVAAFLDRPSAIVGTTGAGKTFAAKGTVDLADWVRQAL